MPKEKKKGLFSLFRKKAPKEQPPTALEVVSPPNSYVDINDLIPSTEFIYQKPIETPVKTEVPVVEKLKKVVVVSDPVVPEKPKEVKVDRQKKKARAAPPPPRERAVDVGGEGPKKPPRDLNALSVEEKKAIIRKQLSEDQEQERASSRKSSQSSGSRVVETNVLHYSPQTQNRPFGSSPIPVSDAPPVERQSNIILNGTARIKTIPVTQYDGRPKQVAPPPPPPPPLLVQQERVLPAPVPPPMTEVTSPTAYHKKQTSLDSAMSARTPMLDAPPKAVYRSPVSTISAQHVQKNKEEEILQRRYEEIKRKFDLWQALKSDERHAKEAKKLHIELIEDHDSLMAIVNQSNGEQDVPSPGQTQRKRPSIAPDTYTPRLPVTNSLRSPLSITATHSSSSLGSSSSSSPGTSRSVTPKNAVSSPSVSPAASVDSSDSGVAKNGRHSDYATPRIEMKKSQSIDENANHLKRISKPRDSLELQKQHAINRINDEVRAQRAKEQELKRFSQPALMHIEVVEKERPVSNGHIAESVKIQPKLVPKEIEIPKTAPSPKQSNGVSRVMVNTSPAPSTVQKQPVLSKETTEKTIVAMNKSQEKIYTTPKPVPSVSWPLESPKTPPLPATPQPKLPSMSRTMSADDDIYKVSKKEENNNNVTKLSPVKETKPARSPTSEKKRRHVTREVRPAEQKPLEVTSAIKSTIRETSRVEAQIKIQKGVDDKGTVSRNIRDTLADHKTLSRPALDLSVMLEQTTLRKVAPPVERNGIAMGRVVDGTPTPSTSAVVSVTYLPPPPPPPPMMMMMIAVPPPPPPIDLMRSPIYQVPSPMVRPSSIPAAPPAPPPLVTSSQLTDQKQRLRTPIIQTKSASPLDLRDSLMAEIRNAGGGRGLRKVNRN